MHPSRLGSWPFPQTRDTKHYDIQRNDSWDMTLSIMAEYYVVAPWAGEACRVQRSGLFVLVAIDEENTLDDWHL